MHYTCTKKTNFSQCEETCLLLFDSTLGPVPYHNIHRTGLLKTGAQLEKFSSIFIQVNFTSEKVRSKPHLSTQWARVQVATYTQKMFNKIGNRCGWGKFESCLSNEQNELQVFFKPCSHWKFVQKKKTPTFCNTTNSFSMKWCLKNKHKNFVHRHHFWQGNWWKHRKMLLVFSGYWKSPHLNVLQRQPMSLILSSFYSSFL